MNILGVEAWSWEIDKRVLADLDKIKQQYESVHEFDVSPDGERIAVPVKTEEGFTACVNGELWPEVFEILWYLRFSAANRLTGLVRIDDEWTLADEGKPWEERFEYAWNPRYSANGKGLAMACKRDNQYGIILNGKVWKNSFLAIRDFCISDDGSRTAATVQMAPLKEADVFGFFEGVWSVAVDGELWDTKFINAWNPVFDPDGKDVAAEIRTDICEYSVAINGKSWEKKFGCVWQPQYRPGSRKIVAPVRHEGNWTLAEDGNILWTSRFNQLWNHRFSPDGSRIAAIAATEHGLWTVVVDDVPWNLKIRDMVLTPAFSPDGKRVAALVKNDNRWTMAVDGSLWPADFNMLWDPIFSPDGGTVMAMAEQGGKFGVAIDGKVPAKFYDKMWQPVFSPDGQKALLKYVESGKYCREVVPLSQLHG